MLRIYSSGYLSSGPLTVVIENLLNCVAWKQGQKSIFVLLCCTVYTWCVVWHHPLSLLYLEYLFTLFLSLFILNNKKENSYENTDVTLIWSLTRLPNHTTVRPYDCTTAAFLKDTSIWHHTMSLFFLQYTPSMLVMRPNMPSQTS